MLYHKLFILFGEFVGLSKKIFKLLINLICKNLQISFSNLYNFAQRGFSYIFRIVCIFEISYPIWQNLKELFLFFVWCFTLYNSFMWFMVFFIVLFWLWFLGGQKSIESNREVLLRDFLGEVEAVDDEPEHKGCQIFN